MKITPLKLIVPTIAGVASFVCCQGAFAATTFYDLTSGGSATINGAVFSTDTFQSSGTGIMDPFLRIQQSGNNTYEAGYNTSLGTPLNDDNSWNYDLMLSDLQSVNVGGTDYYVFRLDLNEPKNSTDNQISLNQVQIFGSTDPAALGVTMDPGTGRAVGSFGSGASLVYDMNSNADPTGNSVVLDYALYSGGSGSGDMQLLIPTSMFSGLTYVIMYSQFGSYPITNGVPSNAGFEEWSALKGQGTVVPEPSTIIAGALLLVPLGVQTYRRMRK